MIFITIIIALPKEEEFDQDTEDAFAALMGDLGNIKSAKRKNLEKDKLSPQ